MQSYNDTVSTFAMSSGSLNGTGTLTATTYNITGGTVNAQLAGASAVLDKDSAAELVLNSENTYGGGTIIRNGKVKVNHKKALGLATASLAVEGGELDIDGVDPDVGAVTLSDGTISGSGTLTGSSYDVRKGAVTAKLGGSAGLTKSTADTVTLSGANTYSGNTMISAGTLKLGSGGSIASSVIEVANSSTFDVQDVAFTLASGQTLKGGGTVAGDVIVEGTLAPGNSPGTQTHTGDDTWAGGGLYEWEIDDATGTQGGDPGWDFLDIEGNLAITATAANPFVVDIISLVHATHTSGDAANFDNTQPYTWTIAHYGGAFSMDGGDDFASRFSLVDSFTNDIGMGEFSIAHDAVSQNINILFVPEPATLALLGLGGLAMLVRRRMR